jgi:hypothetical protein
LLYFPSKKPLTYYLVCFTPLFTKLVHFTPLISILILFLLTWARIKQLCLTHVLMIWQRNDMPYNPIPCVCNPIPLLSRTMIVGECNWNTPNKIQWWARLDIGMVTVQQEECECIDERELLHPSDVGKNDGHKAHKQGIHIS